MKKTQIINEFINAFDKKNKQGRELINQNKKMTLGKKNKIASFTIFITKIYEKYDFR